MRFIRFRGPLPGEFEAEPRVFVLREGGGRTEVLAAGVAADAVAARVKVEEDREAVPGDIAEHYARLAGPDARARSRFRLKVLLALAEEEEAAVLPEDFWIEALGGPVECLRIGGELARLGILPVGVRGDVLTE